MLYPETASHPHSHSISRCVVGTEVGLVVVVDIKIVQESLSSVLLGLLHFRQEPGQEVGVVMSSGVCPSNHRRPVYNGISEIVFRRGDHLQNHHEQVEGANTLTLGRAALDAVAKAITRESCSS